MDEPNRPSIVATKKNIERPPPMAIAFLLRSNQQGGQKADAAHSEHAQECAEVNQQQLFAR